MALFASLTTEIKNLQSSLLSNNSLTLQWCVEAMTLLKKLHSQFLLIILEKSKVIPFTWINDDMLNLYMNESLYIMELCNMLKSSSFKINMYHLTIDTTIKNLNHYEAKTFANMQPIEQRDNKRILIQEMQRGCCSSLICTIRVAMSLLSYILLNVFMYPTKNYNRICCKYSSPIKSFKDSVNELATEFQRKYYKDGERGVIRFYEYEEMEKAIMEAKEEFKSGYEEEETKRIKDVILQKSIALKVGLEKFESQVNQVFEEVLKGRNKLLQMVGKTNGIFR
ncbi:hypothetical protein H5410_055468 [Solanum commersonii]|uniref:Uncharacterized protein n=1 Tax=Solanum commersonii TaxID=4109 RepID=A0A9J5WKD8_SOLCO|nr:hypothetical protein H5410_055468 [Solanum commersonii]